MSGCYPGQEAKLPSCIHGIVDYCNQCEQKLWQKIREFEVRIEGLHANKLQQIDLNKKAEKIIEGHQKQINDIIGIIVKGDNTLENDVIRIERKIEKLESENKMRQDTIGCLDSAYNEAFRNVETKLDKLENKISNWEEEFYFIQGKLREYDKKPHKCPVCDGKYIAIFKECECACLACDRGIVWG